MDVLSAPHALGVGDVCRATATSPGAGLTTSEAAARLAAGGFNRAPDAPRPPVYRLVWRQLANSMVALLALAAGVSLAIGELLDATIIMAVVVINTCLGYVQESRAETASRALRRLLAPRATVIRDSQALDVDAADIVPGDVVVIRAGDRIPADGRLVEVAGLEVDESTLTGESASVAKRTNPPDRIETELANRRTCVYSGTTVTRGSARMVVTATGLETQVQHIIKLAEEVERPRTPLQIRLDQLSAQLLRIAGAMCLAIALIALIQGDSIEDSLLIGVSLAVAAIPEGLPVVLTVALALGVRRMARHDAIVRRLQAVETLGALTVICADKTGTLTQNEMRLTRAYVCRPDREFTEIEGVESEQLTLLLSSAALACEEMMAETSQNGSSSLADPTETAIIEAAATRGATRDALFSDARVTRIKPFDPIRKRVVTTVESSRGVETSYMKGAPEALVSALELGPEERSLIDDVSRQWAGAGIRVLAVARGQSESDSTVTFQLLGLIGLSDPPRPASRPGVELARSAGIRTVMITGDHPRTAAAIARAVSIVVDDDRTQVATGKDLDQMSERELSERSRQISVYARVAPEHKLRIVEALAADGQIVAMTGDGVNDVPALRAAQVGIAMGRGTDAAKAAADVVLTDDDYATIVHSVRRGRAIYDNVLRFLLYLLSANTGEVITFALAIALGMSAPLTVVQILLVNLLTDGLPALALANDPPAANVMTRPPRPVREQLLAPIWTRLIAVGIPLGLAAFVSFVIGQASDPALGRTMAFTTLVAAQLVVVFSVRGDDWPWRAGRNIALLGAVAISAFVLLAALAVEPIASALELVGMSASNLTIALTLGLVPVAAIELVKMHQRRVRTSTRN